MSHIRPIAIITAAMAAIEIPVDWAAVRPVAGSAVEVLLLASAATECEDVGDPSAADSAVCVVDVEVAWVVRNVVSLFVVGLGLAVGLRVVEVDVCDRVVVDSDNVRVACVGSAARGTESHRKYAFFPVAVFSFSHSRRRHAYASSPKVNPSEL